MMDDFLWRALAAALGVAVVAGPLGCFVIWRRMAYYGESLAHSALLGVALGLVLGMGATLGVIVVCAVLTLLLVVLQEQRRLATDALLGILAHGALSLGLVVVALLETLRVDLFAYLFGDVLAVTAADLAWVYGGGAAVLGILAAIWRPLLAATVHEELALAEGINVRRVRIVFMFLIATVIAVSMKIVGMLLIVALLIIPAATARRFARTPERMAVIAAATGVVAACAGLAASLAWDAPAGPAIVVAAFALFGASLGAGALTTNRP